MSSKIVTIHVSFICMPIATSAIGNPYVDPFFIGETEVSIYVSQPSDTLKAHQYESTFVTKCNKPNAGVKKILRDKLNTVDGLKDGCMYVGYIVAQNILAELYSTPSVFNFTTKPIGKHEIFSRLLLQHQFCLNYQPLQLNMHYS